jgi:hypothetical protein
MRADPELLALTDEIALMQTREQELLAAIERDGLTPDELATGISPRSSEPTILRRSIADVAPGRCQVADVTDRGSPWQSAPSPGRATAPISRNADALRDMPIIRKRRAEQAWWSQCGHFPFLHSAIRSIT